MGENELRWQLRQLPREMEPPRDLWPGIARRLTVRPRRRQFRWTGLALAASLALVAGLVWQLRPARGDPIADLRADLVQRQAEALVAEYEAALRELEAVPVPPELAPALDTLDASALEIRRALAQDPGEVRLLDQLRRTYARRLSLTQRAALG
ncbi:hypothetical protein [Arenimonas fontis]|uniref:Uncharacterized protein n=1 Tax=Arenimonas fontis TaxID=2608255 RepID=A0A5B2ZB88_9GAMM|nr:hypothetical protein [Arenimonas fontis]KAA2285237.1 hypothetical protein F0415_04775 [Arenimonas fontis]